MTVKRANETTIDLEQTIVALVYRKKKLDLDSLERQLINRVLTGLRYSDEDAGGIIEDLDFNWGATFVLSLQRPRQSRGKSCRFVELAKKRSL
jgi:gamma-glutamyl-gamma-aminobutyrate hydrolase PuuD